MSSYVEYHRFSRYESCVEEGCRSRKWYIEDGKKFCERGHEQTGFTQTQQDEDDFNIQGKTSRKKGEEIERVRTVLTGKDATELYLQCYQLILWKQCFWLVSAKGFPKELETVVRDLWALWLRTVHSHNEDGGYESGTGTLAFSSMSGGDTTDTDGMSYTSAKSRSNHVGKGKLPKLIQTLALCYLGIMLMRFPTSLGEIYKWAVQGEMPFTRAIKEVPKELRSRLPAHFHSALEIRSPLKGSTLHKTVFKLVQFYHFNFEMIFPPLNVPLLIFKHMRDLGLSLEIYYAVRHLAAMLEIDFSYLIPQKRLNGVKAYPEIQLMSLIVIATKLSHPFDDIVRHPESDVDPTIMKIKWSKWRDIMAESSSGGSNSENIIVTDEDVFGMSKKKMDDYLDWFQRTWIDDRESKVAEKFLELFPLPDLPNQQAEPSNPEHQADRLKQVQQSSVIQKPIHSGDDCESESPNITRPGEFYRRYRTSENLPDNAKDFYEVAAKTAGTSLQQLIRGVFQTEVMIEDWVLSDRKTRMADREVSSFD